METLLLLFATIFVAPIIVILLYAEYVKFLLWRCKLVYDEKVGYWALPFVAWIIGFIKFLRFKNAGNALLYQKFIALREWILYQYADGNYIYISMANNLAFEKICQIFFARKSVQHC